MEGNDFEQLEVELKKSGHYSGIEKLLFVVNCRPQITDRVLLYKSM